MSEGGISSEGDDRAHGLRIVKRYTNRKLYDTLESRYVTLMQLARLVREGYDIRVIDSATSEDLTQVTLALIIFEEERLHTHSIPLQTLREVILFRRGSLFAQLRNSALESLFPTRPPKVLTDPERTKGTGSADAAAAWSEDAGASVAESSREAKADLHHWLEDRAHAMLATFRPFLLLQREVVRLRRRIDSVESKLRAPGGDGSEAAEPVTGQ
jgi:polyhydroxyalkanoate synthesis repressor PhaR